MINKILHIADIHIKNSPEYHQQYRNSLNHIISVAKTTLPDRICIVGDLFHNYTNISNEAIVMASEFLFNLSKISKIIITVGNHDINLSSSNRVDSVETVVSSIKKAVGDNIIYYNKTGIYHDDNIAWVVYHHPDKKLVDIPLKSNEYTYIGLFHDPIRECHPFGGNHDVFNNKKFRSIEDFCDLDFLLMGDIHKFQTFDKSSKLFAAYSSSPICQNFGEIDSFHGVLLWDLPKNIIEQIPIDHEIRFVQYNMFENNFIEQINGISLDSDFLYRIKVKLHIKNHDLFKSIKNQIIFEFNDRFKNIKDLVIKPYFSESVDKFDKYSLIDTELHVNKYLSDMNLSDKMTAAIKNMDHEISTLVTDNNEYIDWNILSITIFNFRSYPDREITIDFKDGIIKIDGENQSGKSNIYNAITYLLYGKTYLSKKVKHQDLKFINNNTESDKCYVKGTFIINNDEIIISRETTIKRNKNNEIKSISTKCSENQDDMIKYFGDLSEFMNSCFINSDNLNHVLSMDNRIFKDRLISDFGLHIFERKHSEAKKLKNQYISDNGLIKIDESKHREKISELSSKKAKIIDDITFLEKSIETNKTNKSNLELEKNDTYLSIKELPKNLDTMDAIDNIQTKLNGKLKELNGKLKELQIKKHHILNKNIDKIISTNKTKILDINKNIKLCENKLELLNSRKKSLNDKLAIINNKLVDINQKFNNINDTNNSIDNSISEIRAEIESTNDKFNKQNQQHELHLNNLNINKSTLNQKLNGYLDIKDRLQDDRESIDNNICPTCGGDVVDDKMILSSNKEIDDNNSSINSTRCDIDEIELKISALTKSIESTNNEYVGLIKKLETKLNKLNSKLIDISDIQKDLSSLTNDQINVNNKLSNIDTEKTNLEISIVAHKENIENINSENLNLKKNIDDDIKLIDDDIKEISNKLDDIKEKISKVHLVKENISINLAQASKLIDINNEISILDNTINELNGKLSDSNIEYGKITHDISEANQTLEKYLIQRWEISIFNYYMEMMGRDGIPYIIITDILKNMQIEFDHILSDQEFNIFFDDMSLFMYNINNPDGHYSVLDGSGKERTLISLILRFLIRKYNSNFNCNILLIDEILGKLSKNSVEEFKKILKHISNGINTIFIVEHSHDIDADHVISVKKSNNLSNIEWIY